MAARKAFGLAAVACALLVMLGSWAPLRFHDANLPDVWQVYLNAGTSVARSRGDLVANILLGIPFAYTLMGFLSPDTKSHGRRLAVPLFTMAAAIVLAIMVELGQGWIPGRVPSIRDTLAQVLGASIGCIGWWVTGDQISRLMNGMLVGDRPFSRLHAAISLTALGVLVWSVLPANVLVSPVDLARKWADGNIELIPFTRSQASVGESIYQWIASIILAIPLGLWASQFLKFTVKRSTSVIEKALIALGVGLLPETLQIPIAARVASATDALFGVIGAGLGICLGELLWKNARRASAPQLSHPIQQPAFWYLTTALYFLIVCVLSWYPFHFKTNPHRIQALLHEVASNPFSDYQGSNLKTLFVFARLAVISSILGVLAGIGTGLIRHQAVRIAIAGGMFLAAIACSVALEFGQLLESTHSGAGLGLTMRVLATWSGLALGIVASRGRGLFAGANERRTQPTEPSIRDEKRGTVSVGAVNRDLYVPGIDGLRAIACLAVFCVHWQQMTGVATNWGPLDFAQLLDNGNTGVAMFMILSGFLLALPILATEPKQRARYSVRDFVRRRIAKIVPVYYVCLFGLVLIKMHFRSSWHLIDVVLHLAFLHNLTPSTLYSISPPFWALAPIIQFYVLFAFVVVALGSMGRLSDRAIVGTFAIICVVSQVLVTALSCIEPWAGRSEDWIGPMAVCLEHSLASHACLFGLGIFAAWSHCRVSNESSKTADAIVLSCMLATLLILGTALDATFQIPGGRYNFPIVPLLLTAIVLAAPRGRHSRNLLEKRAIKRLGIISYGFYLFHLPMMQLLNTCGQKLGFPASAHAYLFAALSAALTVMMSELVYQLLERPAANRLRTATGAARSS